MFSAHHEMTAFDSTLMKKYHPLKLSLWWANRLAIIVGTALGLYCTLASGQGSAPAAP